MKSTILMSAALVARAINLEQFNKDRWLIAALIGLSVLETVYDYYAGKPAAEACKKTTDKN